MGNAFGLYEAVTRCVDKIHADGLNTDLDLIAEIQKSVIRSSPALIPHTLSAITRSAVDKMFTESGLSHHHKTAVLHAMDIHDYDTAYQIVLQAANEKLADNSRELFAESGGKRGLKTVLGTHLCAYDVEKKLDMASAQVGKRFYIEEWHGKVVFKAVDSPDRFFRTFPDGSVYLVLSLPGETPELQWLPFKNDDGSWSFLSYHGRWGGKAEHCGKQSSVGTLLD